jgi:hypothetical protein
MTKGNLDVELYNIAEDIAEQHDLSDEHPDRVAKLAKMMEEVRTPSSVFPLIPLDQPAKQRKNR